MKAPIARCLLATFAILSLPASAWALPQVGGHKNGFSIPEERYLHTYVECWDAFKAQCGRNIVDDRLASGEAPSDQRVKAATATMQRWLSPPEPGPVASASSGFVAPAPAPTTVTTTSAGGCPSYMVAEADSPSDVNPTSGAAGCFQITPGTAAANGCTDVGPDCAARVCASQGPSAWASSGANPCPYVQP